MSSKMMKKIATTVGLMGALTLPSLAGPSTVSVIHHTNSGETEITIHGQKRPAARVAQPAAPNFYEVNVVAAPSLHAARGWSPQPQPQQQVMYAPQQAAAPPAVVYSPNHYNSGGLTPLYDTGSDDYGFYGAGYYGDYGYGYPGYGYGYGYTNNGFIRGRSFASGRSYSHSSHAAISGFSHGGGSRGGGSHGGHGGGRR